MILRLIPIISLLVCLSSCSSRQSTNNQIINNQTINNDVIKVYVMETCPDCAQVKKIAAGNPQYELIDIGVHIRNLKEFLRLRDKSPEFDEAKQKGYAGIPCFVLKDGTITFDPAEAGLDMSADAPAPAGSVSQQVQGESCAIDGSGC